MLLIGCQYMTAIFSQNKRLHQVFFFFFFSPPLYSNMLKLNSLAEGSFVKREFKCGLVRLKSFVRGILR